jgi:hypothetical protein
MCLFAPQTHGFPQYHNTWKYTTCQELFSILAFAYIDFISFYAVAPSSQLQFFISLPASKHSTQLQFFPT